jgi:predicted CopG family antitoxin
LNYEGLNTQRHMSYVRMATKNIAIREDVYKKLLSSKRDEESFSDAIDRLLQRKTSLLSFAGSFTENDKELKVIEKEVRKTRKKATLRASSL